MHLRSALYKSLISFLFLMISFTGIAKAQNGSAVGQLDGYETHLYMRTFEGESVIMRLERLEVDVLGQKQQGALFQRLRKLEKPVYSKTTGNLNVKQEVTQQKHVERTNKPPKVKVDEDIPGLYTRMKPGVKNNNELPSREELEQLKNQKRNEALVDLDDKKKVDDTKKLKKKTKQITEEEENKESEPEFDPDAASYFDILMHVNKGKVIRWKKMPIKIFLPAGTNITYRDKYRRAAIRAFNIWKLKSNGVIDYVLVDNPKQADVEVIWQENFPESMEKAEETTTSLGYNVDQAMVGNVIGSSSMFVPGYYGYAASLLGAIVGGLGNTKKIRNMKLRIGTLPAMRLNEDAAMNVVESIASHEYGHALGLSCHSVNKDDLMYYEVPFDGSDPRMPTGRDIKTILELYSVEADITD